MRTGGKQQRCFRSQSRGFTGHWKEQKDLFDFRRLIFLRRNRKWKLSTCKQKYISLEMGEFIKISITETYHRKWMYTLIVTTIALTERKRSKTRTSGRNLAHQAFRVSRSIFLRASWTWSVSHISHIKSLCFRFSPKWKRISRQFLSSSQITWKTSLKVTAWGCMSRWA